MAEAGVGSADPRPRVLYIQDETAERGRVAAALRAAGFDVVEAESGLAGIEAATACHPDLLLVDLHLPDLDGSEVASKLRRLGMAGLPIVAIGEPKTERGLALSAGCDGTIAVTPDLSRLPGQLREFLAGRRDKLKSGDEKRYLKEYSQSLVEKLESKVRELTATNERMKRIDAFKTEFMQSISHELSTPLTPLIGYLKILNSEKLGGLNDRQKKVLESTIQSAERLTRTVDNLADFAVLASGDYRVRLSAVNAVSVAEKVVEGVQYTTARAKRVHVSVLARDRDLQVMADEARLGQALGNIVDNAVRYSPHGGEVLIDVRGHGDRLSFAIYDQGPGVPAEEQDRIFEPYHSKGARHIAVAGLGLPVARRIAEAHGGRLYLECPPKV
ncbi:MAG: ATP-binding protein, partial [Myxococcales bacterium]